jgi:hypothetical protein
MIQNGSFELWSGSMLLLGGNFFKACFMGRISEENANMAFGVRPFRHAQGAGALQKLNARGTITMLTLPTGFIFNYRAATRAA